MTLQDIFDNLNAGPLVSVAITNDGAGIQGIDYPRIIASLNQIMDEIFIRFNIRHREVVVCMLDGKTTYPISSEFAVTNKKSTAPYRWVADCYDCPFQDDIVSIDSVTLIDGDDLPLNDPNDAMSVFTPHPSVIQIPDQIAKAGYSISVVYRANAPKIPVDTTAFMDTFIELPDQFMTALVQGVSAKVFGGMGGQDAYYKKQACERDYENSLSKLEIMGVAVSGISTSDKIMTGGWV